MAKREVPIKEDSVQTHVEKYKWKRREHYKRSIMYIKSLDRDHSTLTIWEKR